MISIVVPMHNEEENIPHLVEELTAVCDRMSDSYEIILVDDGSRDSTWEVIVATAKAYPALRGVRLSRNFGHQAALMAGMSEASGQAVISMDGDLQHPPALLPDLIASWKNGNKVVNTRRIDGAVTGPFKKHSSSLFYRILSSLAEIKIEKGTSDFRLLDRSVVEEILNISSEPFLRGIVQWVGFQADVVEFEVAKRRAGTSKYNLKKMVSFALAGILSFSTKPLRLGIWIGAATSMLSFAYLAYIVAIYLQGQSVPGWASVTGILTLMFGILFLVIGVLGLYISRIHEILMARPSFIISSRYDASEGT